MAVLFQYFVAGREEHPVPTYRAPVRSSAELGALLQQARLLAGLSQRQLAERLGTDQSYIWQLEAGKQTRFTERLFAFLSETDARLSIEISTRDDSDSSEAVL